MKNYIYLISLVVICFLYFRLLDYIGLPYWMVITCIPLFAYGLLYATNKYNFRNSLDFQPIPFDMQKKGAKMPGKNYLDFNENGFIKFDEFYWQTTNDIFVYAYYHETFPIILCSYKIGGKEFVDLVSKFENGFTLTTSNTELSGVIPRDNKNMLQILLERNFVALLAEHKQSIEFLQERQFKLLPLNLLEFRAWFKSDYRKVGKSINNLAGPIKLLYWKFSSNEKVYIKSIQEQFLAKTQKLPQNLI